MDAHTGTLDSKHIQANRRFSKTNKAMIEFTFHVECGKQGFMFGMKPPNYDKATITEKVVMRVVCDAAKEAVNKLAMEAAKDTGTGLAIGDFEGKDSYKLSEEMRRRVIEGDDDP